MHRWCPVTSPHLPRFSIPSPLFMQGGNTGLVGGGMPVFDEVILSMRAMQSVKSFNQVWRVGGGWCDAGSEELQSGGRGRGWCGMQSEERQSGAQRVGGGERGKGVDVFSRPQPC